MKKVYIQVIDPVHNTIQSACIQEPVEPQLAINNACRHLGFDSATVAWSPIFISKEAYPNMPPHICMMGSVKETPKLVTIVEVDEIP